MVSLSAIRASNARIRTTLPPGLVAIFVGATSGIGEYTLKELARQAQRPRVHFVGRSQEAGIRIAEECSKINPEGEFNFIQADCSLLQNIDNVCRDIKAKGKAINILFLSQGTLVFGTKSSEGLHTAIAIAYYGRTRFILNLLPELKAAKSLRRVVSCFTGCKEGPVDLEDIQGWNKAGMSIAKVRGHGASLTTTSLETLSQLAPTVSFIHDFPGPVKSGIGRGFSGILMVTMVMMFKLLGPLIYIPQQESGERHLFLATSAAYPAETETKERTLGVPVEGEVNVARATDGQKGSGTYSVDEKCESADHSVETLLAGFRKDGTRAKLWGDVMQVFKRITGTESL